MAIYRKKKLTLPKKWAGRGPPGPIGSAANVDMPPYSPSCANMTSSIKPEAHPLPLRNSHDVLSTLGCYAILSLLRNVHVQGGPKKWGHKLMTIILSIHDRFKKIHSKIL